MNPNMKKTALAAAITTALGAAAMPAAADVVDMTFSGVFSMINPTGSGMQANPDTPAAAWYGNRTNITGTMAFDLHTFAGTGTVAAFSFFGGGAATASAISFVSIGNGFGGPGSLVLGNMGFAFGPTTGIPVSLVMDAAGLFGALTAGGTTPPDANNVTTSQIITGGATPASDVYTFGKTKNPYTLPVGAGPIVTTLWKTTNLGSGTGGAIVLGDNPSGTLPLTLYTDGQTVGHFSETVAGNPMAVGPFPGNFANFDITTIHIPPSAVPVPAAVWLFGSGLLGLVGVARRRRKTV